MKINSPSQIWLNVFFFEFVVILKKNRISKTKDEIFEDHATDNKILFLQYFRVYFVVIKQKKGTVKAINEAVK